MLHRRKIVTGQWESEAMWSRIHLERKYIIGSRFEGRTTYKPARWTRAIQLLGKHLNPLDDVQLLFGVDERLEEEGGGKLGRHQGNVVSRPICLLAEGGRQELNHLPHEVEVCVVKYVVVLNEVSVVLPDPVLEVRGEAG